MSSQARYKLSPSLSLRLAIRRWINVGLALCILTSLTACRSTGDFPYDPELDHYRMVASEIEFPNVQSTPEENPPVLESGRPLTLRSMSDMPAWNLSLEEAVRTALLNSTVIRDAGGRVVTTPAASSTVFDPAMMQADPNLGVEAALAAFDANFATGLFVSRDERAFNNLFFGGGAASLSSNIGQWRTEINKTAATGTQFALRHQVDYNRNNSPVNLFASAYDSFIEGEFRHPLLQGSGIAFNRIAGPNSRPGQYNGVMLARLNSDVALTDFERAVRDLVRDVEISYWNLYFAYRDLEAKIARRDASLQTWRIVQAQLELGRADGEREALAREQYYAAKSAVEDSLTGISGTPGGVHASERLLRRLLGLPTNDGRLIRPSDNPIRMDVLFDWEESVTEALWRRAELRRQKWVIERRELELLAAENFLQMRLDMVGQYRWRGFGDQLLGDGPPNTSTYQDLFDGDLQGWQFGLQLSTPIGNRQAHSAFRHAELQLARERALLREQELQITHDLADAFAELDRSFQVAKTNFNRAIAAQQQVDPIQAKYEAGEALLENVLDAQSRAADATSAFYRSLVQYSVAIANLHYSRGSLLDYHQIQLNEGPWTDWAHTSALKQARRFRFRADCDQEPCQDLSRGPYAQDVEDFGGIGQLPSEAALPPAAEMPPQGAAPPQSGAPTQPPMTPAGPASPNPQPNPPAPPARPAGQLPPPQQPPQAAPGQLGQPPAVETARQWDGSYFRPAPGGLSPRG